MPKKVETLPDICLVLQTQLGPAKKQESWKFALDTLTLQTEVFKGLWSISWPGQLAKRCQKIYLMTGLKVLSSEMDRSKVSFDRSL
jgi:hypothetical protein